MNRRGFITALAAMPIVAIVPTAKAVPLPRVSLILAPAAAGMVGATRGWYIGSFLPGMLERETDDADLSHTRLKDLTGERTHAPS